MHSIRKATAQEPETPFISWSAVAEMPLLKGMNEQLGVAGPFAGVNGGALLLAGGANFPDGMPWLGGKKRYRDEIYVLLKDTAGNYSWLSTDSFRLPHPLAYGGSCSLPDGIVCIGGEDEKGPVSSVFLLRWMEAGKRLSVKSLPDLPLAISNPAVTAIGSSIFVAGGETAEKAQDLFMVLDTKAARPSWGFLPTLPFALSNAVAVTQSNGVNACIYILGGRAKTPSGISELHNTTFCFDPAKGRWQQLAPVGDGKHISNYAAGTGFAWGNSGIVLTGGDNGILFNRIEKMNVAIAAATTKEETEEWRKKKSAFLNDHPGFCRDILFFNTLTGIWTKTGELPFAAPVTTTAVKWGDLICIPGGEIKPGVRSREVRMGCVKTFTGRPEQRQEKQP